MAVDQEQTVQCELVIHVVYGAGMLCNKIRLTARCHHDRFLRKLRYELAHDGIHLAGIAVNYA